MSSWMLAGARRPSGSGAPNPGSVSAKRIEAKQTITERIGERTGAVAPLKLERAFDTKGPLHAVLIVLPEQPGFVVVVNHGLVKDVSAGDKQSQFTAEQIFGADVPHEALLLVACDRGAHDIEPPRRLPGALPLNVEAADTVADPASRRHGEMF